MGKTDLSQGILLESKRKLGGINLLEIISYASIILQDFKINECTCMGTKKKLIIKVMFSIKTLS